MDIKDPVNLREKLWRFANNILSHQYFYMVLYVFHKADATATQGVCPRLESVVLTYLTKLLNMQQLHEENY